MVIGNPNSNDEAMKNLGNLNNIARGKIRKRDVAGNRRETMLNSSMPLNDPSNDSQASPPHIRKQLTKEKTVMQSAQVP